MGNPVQLFDITFSNHDYLTRLQSQVYGEWTETFEWSPKLFLKTARCVYIYFIFMIIKMLNVKICIVDEKYFCL